MNYLSKYNEDGFISAIDIFSKDECIQLQHDINNTINRYDILNNEYRCKSHILFKWVDEIANHPKIINIVTELLGQNVICHDAMFWGKNPGTNQFVSFHQDGYYWNIKEPVKGVTVWVPFQDTILENGTIQYINKSHTQFYNHVDQPAANNMLKRGQTVNISKLGLPVIACPTKLGQVTMHHPYNVHGSYSNNSDKVRLAINIQYIDASSVSLVDDYEEYGILVSGFNKSNIKCVSRPSNNFEDNYQIWKIAQYNQRQNYLKISNRN